MNNPEAPLVYTGQAPPDICGVKDLASFFGVTRRTIRRWRNAGKLPEPLIPGYQPKWLFSEVMDFLRN